MTISDEQTESLLGWVAATRPDQLDCDGCFGQMAEFVEYELAQREIPDAVSAVKRHLQQCGCCHDEHAALLQGLSVLDLAGQ